MAKLFKLSSISELFGAWQSMNSIPGGKWFFSKFISFIIPYTGSIKPAVQHVEKGHAIVMLRDRRAVSNHLRCVHAIALANVGEFTTGLALISQLDEKSQAILVNLNVNYLKKARGTLTAEAVFQLPPHIENNQNHVVIAHIKNEHNELVSTVTATWRIRLNDQ